MKILSNSLICGLVTIMLCGFVRAEVVPDSFVQNQKIGRGVNILGYDPIWRSRDQARFKAGYFQRMKAAGFSSVRINLHPFRYMDATNDWTLRSSWLDVLDWAV